MKVRVHGKPSQKFRLGAYAMTELTLRDLLGKVESSRISKLTFTFVTMQTMVRR